MNFFKSVFSDDPDPPQPGSGSNNAAPDPNSRGNEHGWNFGGLIKTLTKTYESIIETYRHDLQEFGTGLKSENEVVQGSVGELPNTVIKGRTWIISQAKDAILVVHLDSDDSDNANTNREKILDSKRYSRFEAQVCAIQCDASTYTKVPEDLSVFNKWKSKFSLDEKSDEMEGFFRENEAIESVYKTLVPITIDHETFWYRYYYRVFKLKKDEDVRARLARRISREEKDFFELILVDTNYQLAGGRVPPDQLVEVFFVRNIANASITMSELWGIYSALQMAEMLQLNHIWIKTDSKTAMDPWCCGLSFLSFYYNGDQIHVTERLDNEDFSYF
ncbi:BSD domain [Sesbania bispinosa]|nr:BSD domain [Sesbania bispinosa]